MGEVLESLLGKQGVQVGRLGSSAQKSREAIQLEGAGQEGLGLAAGVEADYGLCGWTACWDFGSCLHCLC